MGRSVVEFTGRMTFVARLLLWVKPFLGPLHSWCAVRGTVPRMPVLVHICLMYLRRQFQQRRRLVPVIPSRISAKQAFRTDAKCELGRVVLGGWSLAKGSCKASSRWFMIEIRPSEAPWLFKPDGSSEWASTSAELLAFYAAVIAFEDEIYLRLEEEILAEVSAGTDNQANPQLQAKGSSTKWPLMGILMQLTSYMHCNEQNTEADDITNGDVSGFDPRLRVDLGFKDLPLDLLRDMRKKSTVTLKRKREASAAVKPSSSRPRKSRSWQRRPLGDGRFCNAFGGGVSVATSCWMPPPSRGERTTLRWRTPWKAFRSIQRKRP